MKTKLLFFLLFITFSSVASADNTGTSPTTIISFSKSKSSNDRPQSPSRQEISCEYGDGCLYLSFRYSEGVCSLSVTEIGEVTQVYDFDSSTEAVILVGELTSADITITTEYGHTYKGTLY